MAGLDALMDLVVMIGSIAAAGLAARLVFHYFPAPADDPADAPAFSSPSFRER